jgi:hypothetical protein
MLQPFRYGHSDYDVLAISREQRLKLRGEVIGGHAIDYRPPLRAFFICQVFRRPWPFFYFPWHHC